jgi:hypothetical protein
MTESHDIKFQVRYRHPHPLAGKEHVKSQRITGIQQLESLIKLLARDYPDHPIEVTEIDTITRITCLHNGSPVHYPTSS